MKHKLITVIGNVGAGKSTLVQLLTSLLPAHEVPADSFFEQNPFFHLAVQDQRRWALASDLWFLKKRCDLSHDLDSLLKKSDVIIDSGLIMNTVYAHSRLGSGTYTQPEWDLYQEIESELLLPLRTSDIVIYLQAQPDFLLKRIKQRGRDFEVKSYKKAYLDELNNSLSVITTKLSENPHVKILTIDAEKSDLRSGSSDLKKIVAYIHERPGENKI